MMGGSGAHEYMAPCPAGENEVALAPGYAANVEVASAEPQPVELPAPLRRAGGGRDPGPDDGRGGRRARSGVPAGALIKAMPVDRRGPRHGARPGARRPPPQRDQAAQRARAPTSARRSAEEIEAELGPVGFIGPVGAERADDQGRGDRRATPSSPAPTRPTPTCAACGPARDFEFEEVDVRSVEAGDTAPGGGAIEIEPAIEIGNIFKLGTRYSEPLGATYLDEAGKEHPIVMGSYGIGPARIVAGGDRAGRRRAAGSSGRRSLAPWQRPPGLARQGGRGGARGGRPPLRGAARAPAARSSTTTATPGRGRS